MNGNNKNIKTLFVIDTFGIGGREKVVVALANGLSNTGFEVTVLCLCNNVIDLKKELNEKVKFHTLPFPYKRIGGISAISFWFRGLPEYKRLIKKIQPKIIHTHLFFQHFLFASIGIKSSFLKTRHFHTVHMNGLFYAEKGLINRFRLTSEKFAVYLAKPYIIAISESVLEICNRHFKKNASDIRCIHNGIDKQTFDFNLRKRLKKETFGFRSEDILVTYVARMDEGKDHITLLRAWKKINSLNTHAKLLLAGDGKLKSELLQFTLTDNLRGSVFFLGEISNINEILAITDIGVFTSLFEGFGLAVIEKMYMKIPVVATRIPAITQLIKDGLNGYLFDPKDFNRLSELLMLLIENRNLRSEMGEAAYNTVQTYSVENMIAKHRSYYTNAIGRINTKITLR